MLLKNQNQIRNSYNSGSMQNDLSVMENVRNSQQVPKVMQPIMPGNIGHIGQNSFNQQSSMSNNINKPLVLS